MIVFMYKWLKNAVFRRGQTASRLLGPRAGSCGEKNVLSEPFSFKHDLLPRQARDKHRKNLKMALFLSDDGGTITFTKNRIDADAALRTRSISLFCFLC